MPYGKTALAATGASAFVSPWLALASAGLVVTGALMMRLRTKLARSGRR